MNVGQGVQRRRKLNVCVYGESGTGKSSLAATAPKPVIFLSEMQGYESIVDHSARLGIATPPVFFIRNRDDLAKCVEILQKNSTDPLIEICTYFKVSAAQLPYAKPDSVVCDSVTDMMQLVWDNITEQAPLKTASDGLPDTSMRHWNAMLERGQRLIRMLRDLEYHVIYLCRLDDRESGDGESKGRKVEPLLPMRKLPGILAAACNAVGRMRIKITRAEDKKDDVKTEHWVAFAGPDYELLKPMKPLHDKEVANISDWIARWERSMPAIASAVAGAAVARFDDDDPPAEPEKKDQVPAADAEEKPAQLPPGARRHPRAGGATSAKGGV